MTAGSYTVPQAREAIYTTFYNAWKDLSSGWPSILPTIYALNDPSNPQWPNVIFDDEEPDDDTPTTAPEIYVIVRHIDGKQVSLRGDTGRRWQRTGFLLVRMRFPRDMPLKTADALAKVVNDAFQGKRGFGSGFGILFPRVRTMEKGQTEYRYGIDVIANFEYDEIS